MQAALIRRIAAAAVLATCTAPLIAAAQTSAPAPSAREISADRSQGRELTVDVDRALVREFPHVEAPVLATLSKATTVYELRRVTNWIEVRGSKDRLGWIEAKFLSIGNEAQEQSKSSHPALSALTAAAIAALIVQESRQAYYATGRPCACPDDFTRGGRRCGGNSAYSRPGGAQPLCYPSDVSQQRIEKYRAKNAKTAGK